MCAIATGGRYPAYGDVREYYAREDFLRFLLKSMAVRKVILVIPGGRGHWEPQWDRDRVRGTTEEEVRAWVQARLEQPFAGAALGERLPYYPSFHQSLERWDSLGLAGGPAGVDGVLESDRPTWRESFHDVLTLVEVLRNEGVPYRLKFSGHRSLHVAVPFAGGRLKAQLFGESNAHPTKLLRMPFSLNEDTGLVSLPLRWDGLTSFRPWQAAIPLVGACEDPTWLELPGEVERQRVTDFLRGLKGRSPVSRREYFTAAEIVASCQGRLAFLSGRVSRSTTGPTARQKAWDLLLRGQSLASEELDAFLDAPDADARWLAAEAFLLHGRELPSGQLARLLDSEDPYVRSMTVDLLERFLDESCALFVEELRRPELGAQARWLQLLVQCRAVRDRVIREMGASKDASSGFAFRVACVTGVHLRDWRAAWQIAARVRTEPGLAALNAKRTEALRLIEVIARAYGRSTIIPKARDLAALGLEVVDLVLLAQSSPEGRLAKAFLAVLAEIGDSRGLDALVRGLGEARTALIAVRGLVRLGTPVVPALLEAAASDEARTRRYALRSLGYLGDPRGWPALIAGLRDAEGRVRREAARGLRSPAPPVVRELADAARMSSDEGMDSAAYEAVVSMASHGQEGAEAVRELAFSERNLFAAAYLARQGDPGARHILVDALAETPHRQLEAVELWATLNPDAEVVGAMVGCLPRMDRWRLIGAFEALAALDVPAATQALIDWCRGQDSYARRWAVRALGLCRDPQVLPVIAEMAVDKDAKVREKALEAALAQGAAIEPVAAARADQPDLPAAAKRAYEALRRYLAVQGRLDRREPFTMDLVLAISRGPKPLWDAARRRVAGDESGEAIEQLRSLVGQADRTVVRFCLEGLLAAAGAGPEEEGQGDEDEGAAGGGPD